MAQKTSYFSHDSNARNDEKLLAVRMRHNAEGYGIYFMIIERLRDESDYMSVKDYNVIAFDLRVDASKVKSIVEDFGLFVFTEDGKYFYSESLLSRMEMKDEISVKNSENGKKGAFKRWGKSENIANAIKNDNNPIASLKIPIASKVKKRKEEDPPLIPPKGDEGENASLSWKKDFNVYLHELRAAFSKIKSESAWIEQQESYNPGVDIVKSIEKSCVNYWATEGGWKKKIRSRITSIDWKSTFANAVTQPMNRVYKFRYGEPEQPEKPKLQRAVP